MPDLPTYCDKCGRNFEARYTPSDGLTTLACPHCPDAGVSFGLADVANLPAASRATITRLLERTAEANGEPMPTLPLPDTEPQNGATLTAQVVDVSPLMESMAAFNTWMADLLRPLAQALGVRSPELDAMPDPFKAMPRTPSVGPVFQFKPITLLARRRPLVFSYGDEAAPCCSC